MEEVEREYFWFARKEGEGRERGRERSTKTMQLLMCDNHNIDNTQLRIERRH